MGGPANSGAGIGSSAFGGLGGPIGGIGSGFGGTAMGGAGVGSQGGFLGGRATSGFGAGAGIGASSIPGSISPARQSPSANSLGPNTYGGGFGTPGQGLYGPSLNFGPGEKARMASAMVSENYAGASPTALQAVGDVIGNRMMSGQYPSTARGVINQPGQFSVTASYRGQPPAINTVNKNSPAYSQAMGLAGAIASGELPSTVGTSLNFGNLNTINNTPGYSKPGTKTAFNNMSPQYNIGGHTFGTIGSTNNVPSSRMGMAAPGTAQAFNGMPGAGFGAMAGLNTGAVSPTSIASVGGPSQSLSSVNPAGSAISRVGPSQLSQIGSGQSLSPLSAAMQMSSPTSPAMASNPFSGNRLASLGGMPVGPAGSGNAGFPNWLASRYVAA